ncbi:hypothetical protein CY35_05G039100 [Sphagnum magellanicum]|nr:hypothetical protein CY35_05G039100 [Sphagnum magellanicum]
MQLLVVSIQEKDTVPSSISPAVCTDSKKQRISHGIATHLLVPQTVKKMTDTRAEDEPESGDQQGVIETPAGEMLGLKDPGQVAGEYLQYVLLEYTGDSYPSVREAALKALVRLHSKGYELNNECYKQAIGLFQDCFEPVRIAAIQLVSTWMMTRQNFEDEMSSNQTNEAFLQVCTKATDMNMKVRLEAFHALGGMKSIEERVLLQTLTKKVCGTVSKENGNLSNASGIASESDTDLVKFEEGANLLHASAAGAFVHGLEDEFSEVRTVAMEALAKLACGCEKMVPGAADLLLDMLNDEATSVRIQAMHALSRLAGTGHLSVLDNHLHMDEESVTWAVGCLGQVHPTYAECMTDELLQEMQIFLNGDTGFDEPRCPAILVLFLAAATSNPTVLSLMPPKLLSYARLIRHKLPSSLPLLHIWPTGSKTVQFRWLHRKNTGEMNTGVTGDDTLFSQSTGSEQEGNMRTELPASNNLLPDDCLPESSVSISPVFRESIIPPRSYHPRKEEHRWLYQEDEREVLDCITNIMEAAHSVHKILERKAIKKALLVLRRDLKRLQIRSKIHSAIMRFSALYIQCLTLIAQLQACPSPFRIQTPRLKSESIEDLPHKLEQIVRRMDSCFLGLNLEQHIQLLEFRVLVCLLRISFLPVNATPIDADISLCITHLSSILFKAQELMEHHNLSLSLFLRTVQGEFLQGDVKSCFAGVQKTAQQLGASYWPTSAVVNSNLTETWAQMMAPGSDFEQPIGFIPGLLLGIPVVIVVHNAPESAHFWVQYKVENLLPSFRYLDLLEATSSGKDLSWTAVLQVDEMPSVVSCALKICVVLEADRQEREKWSHIRGPRGPLIPLCIEGAIHLVLNKEKGGKTSQQRR